MLSLHTNAASLSTQNSLSSTQKSLTTSMTRLGTGYRVNSAMDDAAGLQIATRLDAQTRGMAVAQKNTQNGISMLQTADGAMSEVSNILLRMKDLATESANGTSNTDDKAALKAEFDQLSAEITNIMGNTTFGGAKLLTGGTLAGAVDFQIGATSAEVYSVDVSASLGAVTAPTAIGAAADIDTIDTALKNVGTLRSAIGAAANRLDHVYNNLQNISTNVSAARGRIMDTDYATESSTMTTKQMLLQSGTAMLKQSNSMAGLVTSLLG
jgi:flagellin